MTAKIENSAKVDTIIRGDKHFVCITVDGYQMILGPYEDASDAIAACIGIRMKLPK